MKRILVLMSMVAAILMPGLRAQEGAEQKPKAALVNIQELFREYYKTIEAEAQINIERARIQKENNDVQQRVRLLDTNLKEIKQALRAGGGLDDEKRTVLVREAGMRFQERENLERQRKQVVQAQHQELNRRMMARMNGILKEIREIVVEKADRAGYDYVFDSAGLNTSQVPFVLYAKDATDITPIILKELNKHAPKSE